MATIPACPAALPKNSRLGVTAIGVDTPISSWLSFMQFEPGTSQEALELGDDVNTGSLSSLESQYRLNRITVAPQFTSHPTAAEWRTILPWIFDGAESGAGPFAYPLSNTLSKRYMLWDDTQTVWDIYEVAVDTATISASQGDPALKCSLSLVGTNYDKVATFPAGLVPTTDAPFIFTDSDARITIGGTAIKAASVSIQISKNVARDRFFNSTTIACAVSQNRKVTISIQYPWGLHSSLFTAGLTASVPVAVSFVFGAKILTFTMPYVRQQQQAPQASVPQEIMATWTGHCLASSALNDEISASLALA